MVDKIEESTTKLALN